MDIGALLGAWKVFSEGKNLTVKIYENALVEFYTG